MKNLYGDQAKIMALVSKFGEAIRGDYEMGTVVSALAMSLAFCIHEAGEKQDEAREFVIGIIDKTLKVTPTLGGPWVQLLGALDAI
jgi:hypothetical protein